MSSGCFLEVGKTLAYFMHPLGRIYTARFQSPTSAFSVLLKWHRAEFLTWMRKQAGKKMLELRYCRVETRHWKRQSVLQTRRLYEGLASPSWPTQSESQDSRLLYLLHTITEKHALKCSPVTPRPATIKEQKITIIWTTNATQQD